MTDQSKYRNYIVYLAAEADVWNTPAARMAGAQALSLRPQIFPSSRERLSVFSHPEKRHWLAAKNLSIACSRIERSREIPAAMAKRLKTAEELIALLNAELRKHESCEGVSVTEIVRVMDERLQFTWTALIHMSTVSSIWRLLAFFAWRAQALSEAI